VKPGSYSLMEEPTIRGLQNRMPRSLFGLKRKEVTET
jgi:hypothetical protein